MGACSESGPVIEATSDAARQRGLLKARRAEHPCTRGVNIRTRLPAFPPKPRTGFLCLAPASWRGRSISIEDMPTFDISCSSVAVDWPRTKWLRLGASNPYWRFCQRHCSMYVNETPSGAHSEGSFEGSRSVVRPGASQSFTRASCWARFPRKSLRHFFLQN